VSSPRDLAAAAVELCDHLGNDYEDYPNGACRSCIESAAQEAEGWRPIETAPKDVWVLVWTPTRSTVAYRKAEGSWRDVGGGLFIAPTHWMPLPPPPTEEKGR
jgi:hypothetical protein